MSDPLFETDTIRTVRLRGRPVLGCECKKGPSFDRFCAACRKFARSRGHTLPTPQQIKAEKVRLRAISSQKRLARKKLSFMPKHIAIPVDTEQRGQGIIAVDKLGRPL